MRKLHTLAIFVSLWMPARIYAQVGEISDVGGGSSPGPVSHPIISSDTTWAGAVLIGVCFAFAIAAVVGPIAHSFAAEQMPELHDREEHDPERASQREPGHGR